MPKRSDIVTYARSCEGTPWHHQGRVPGVGMDCIGLLVCTAKANRIPYRDIRDYSRFPSGEELLRHLRRYLIEIPMLSARDGSVLVFWMNLKREAQHIGIADGGHFIHAYQPRHQRVIRTAMSPLWRKRLCAAFDVPNVEGD